MKPPPGFGKDVNKYLNHYVTVADTKAAGALTVALALADHYDRRLGISDARIEPFRGMVDCGTPPDPALLRDIQRICENLKKERKDTLEK
jgi:hypothetical protein